MSDYASAGTAGFSGSLPRERTASSKEGKVDEQAAAMLVRRTGWCPRRMHPATEQIMSAIQTLRLEFNLASPCSDRRNCTMTHAFLIGCGKCGTTTLAYLLDQHASIAVSRPKEPNFFSSDEEYARGLQHYHTVFKHKENVKIKIDASVCYSLFDTEKKISKRIRNHFPSPKFIYIARNPYERIESVFRERHHHAHRDRLDIPFNLKEGIAFHLPMLLNSLYWQRTSVFRSMFGEQSILYLTTEDLNIAHESVLRKCFDFLEVADETYPSAEKKILNPGSEKLCDTTLLRLIRKYRPTWSFFESLPQPVHKRLLNALRRSSSCLDITWTNEMRLFMSTFFTNDVSHYLLAAGKPPDFWGKDFV